MKKRNTQKKWKDTPAEPTKKETICRLPQNFFTKKVLLYFWGSFEGFLATDEMHHFKTFLYGRPYHGDVVCTVYLKTNCLISINAVFR